MASFIERILKTGDKKILKQLRGLADAINVLEDEYRELTDADLRAETDRYRERAADGESLDSLLPEAFAAVREAAGRTLGQRHYDVQMMGGAALHLGNIAEMKTGEGKTLVATAPAYLNALTGKGVHVITVNDYLASYQSDLMGRVFRFLGMETGCILSNQDPAERRLQYAADITYGTNNEFGFDYLRDNMAWSLDELVQRGHHFAIVDEVDSILIDEARTPLIISGPSQGDANRWYTVFSGLVPRLTKDTDYEVDEKKKTIGVLEPGIEKIEDWLGITNLYESANTPLIQFLNNAIKAKELFKKDKDYVVMDGEVMIVDEHTGRVLAGRRYNEGMHQAIEAKEGVQIKAENQTLATVTLQNYFRLYDKLSGMTGTAETEAAEFMSTYKLGVVPIPTNKGVHRIDKTDLIYKNEVAKFDAVVEDIVERHEAGQPVLVGTTSVEKSEYLSKLLAKAGVRHEVLNAKNHAREAAIVAQAGRKGAVTVATNMAGRGTDIMLGGNAEFDAVAEMQRRGLDPEENAEQYEQVWPEVLEAAKAAVRKEHDEVRELGGLYVLGTERHESRRIDNQLRGRSGRQGDPGESRFYLSLTDDLMRLFNPAAASRIMNSSSVPDDMALESKMVSSAIQNAQSQVESRNTEQRKNVLKYDDVMNRQREAIYTDRRRILEGDDLHEKTQNFLEDAIGTMVDETTAVGSPTDWDLEQLWTDLKQMYPVGIEIDDVLEESGGLGRLKPADLKRELVSDAKLAYEDREAQIGSEAMRELERRVVLSVIGRKWQDHLYEMDYLKEGIGLRAMAQREPLVEYQREGYIMFQSMMEAIREESVGYLFNLEVQAQQPATSLPGVQDGRGATMTPVLNVKGLEAPRQPATLRFSAPSDSGEVTTQVRRTGTAAEKDQEGAAPNAPSGGKGRGKRKRR
ncbi:preprotein translocase subunit SecA [Micrococcus terreus]|uniref:preprotein translocase subunit SecA n=1 Tax=Micrococcus terreus TaxID=574650 RepID=UPI0023F70234|nr:preprotein translocase subunit SecA [Micrococcus terreus]MDK7701144.1 preprotein translocase subunit SecA [Micrococcus terreus]WOO98634.1 preprotein translocase subunit SecA [Micrococcus terreus]